jgi:hypothetical protein
MTLAAPQIGPTTLGTGSTTCYTVPNVSGNYFICKSIFFLNVSASAVTFNFARVASGGSEADTNRFLKSVTLQPNETFEWSGTLTLAQNESLRGLASASSAVTVTVSGVLNS